VTALLLAMCATPDMRTLILTGLQNYSMSVDQQDEESERANFRPEPSRAPMEELSFHITSHLRDANLPYAVGFGGEGSLKTFLDRATAHDFNCAA